MNLLPHATLYCLLRLQKQTLSPRVVNMSLFYRARWPQTQSEGNSCSGAQTAREKQSYAGRVNQPPTQVWNKFKLLALFVLLKSYVKLQV